MLLVIKKLLELLGIEDHIYSNTKVPCEPPYVIATTMKHFDNAFVFKDFDTKSVFDLFLRKLKGIDKICRVVTLFIAFVDCNLDHA